MVFILVLLLYMIAGTVIAYISRKLGVASTRDYIVAGGRMGTLLSFGTYAATTYSAFMMIGLVGLAYSTGVGALGFELLYLLATIILLSTVGYRVWKLSRERGWTTPSQMLSDLYSSRLLGLLVAGLYLFVMIPYTTAQIQGLSTVFEYAGLDPSMGIIISALLAYIWIFMAGMWSIASTDLYQAFLMLSGGVLLLLLLVAPGIRVFNVSPLEALRMAGENGYLGLTGFWTPQVMLAYTIPWMFFAITNPQVVIRLFIQRDSRVYKRSVLFFAFYGLLYTLIAVLVGLLARGYAVNALIPSNLRNDDVTVYLLKAFNPILGSIIAVSIIAAAVSTVNSIVHAVSSSTYTEILSSKRLKPIVVLNIVSLVIIVLSSILAYMQVSFIVELSVLTSVYLLPLAPLTILGIYMGRYVKKYARTASIISLMAGVLIAVASTLLNGGRKAFTAVYLGTPVSAWILIVSTLVSSIGFLLDVKS